MLRMLISASLIALTGIALTGCADDQATSVEPASRPARLMDVGLSTSAVPLKFVGEVAPAHTVDLGFEIDGTLQALPVSEGQTVSKGQIVAQLNPQRFELALKSAQADHELAEKTLSRVEALKQSGTVSQAELDEAIARAKLTRLAVETARKDLNDTVLRAPFDGRLTKWLTENFSPTVRLTPVIRLAPTHGVEVVIGVPEQLMAGLRPEALERVQVQFSADRSRLFPAQWVDYEAEADRTTQTFNVRFSLTETPPWPVLPGMTATLLLSLNTSESTAIRVPLAALQSDVEGDFFVWVVSRDTLAVEQRAVEAGIPERDSIPILSGLSAGEQIVVAGGAWLHAGMRVRPLGEG